MTSYQDGTRYEWHNWVTNECWSAANSEEDTALTSSQMPQYDYGDVAETSASDQEHYRQNIYGSDYPLYTAVPPATQQLSAQLRPPSDVQPAIQCSSSDCGVSGCGDDVQEFNPADVGNATACHAVVPKASGSHQLSWAVDQLMRFNTNDQDALFSRKAVESLVKRLKDRQTELEALLVAVTSAGTVATSCVTVQRSLDGRLQVANRKGFPHVVYARVWRWPDATKNRLLNCSLFCLYGYDAKADLVCVNPYHYELRQPPGATAPPAELCDRLPGPPHPCEEQGCQMRRC